LGFGVLVNVAVAVGKLGILVDVEVLVEKFSLLLLAPAGVFLVPQARGTKALVPKKTKNKHLKINFKLPTKNPPKTLN
jgi:hypothetical protein